MAFVALILSTVFSAINILVTLRTWRLSRKDRRQPPAHPLEAALRDVAQAIRDESAQAWKRPPR